jgi:hypothetical protein
MEQEYKFNERQIMCGTCDTHNKEEVKACPSCKEEGCDGSCSK